MSGAVISLAPGRLFAQPDEMPPAPVQVEIVEKGAFVQPITLTGSVEPLRQTMVPSELDAILLRLLVDEGDRVTKGQPLAEMRVAPIEIQLTQARAEAMAAQATYDELVAGYRVEDVRMAEAEVAQVEADLLKASQDLQRNQELFNQGAIGQGELDESTRAESAAQARLAARKADLDRLRTGYRPEVIAAQKAALDARKAAVALLEDQLERSTPRAPFDGVIVQKHTEDGSWVGEGDTLFTIAQLNPVRVRMSVPDKFYTSLEVGGTVRGLTVDAYPNRSFQGVISQMIPIADERSRAFPLRIDVPNPENLLVGGMVARLIMQPTTDAEQSIIVPRDAIIARGPKPSVFRVKSGEKGPEVELVEVTTGRFFGGSVEVFGDLQPGDQVITRGNERLQPGQAVDIQRSRVEPVQSSRAAQVPEGSQAKAQ